MELPVNLDFTFHRNGGQILRITSIGHEVGKAVDGRSGDRWFYIGDVYWNDGSNSKGAEIAPFQVCFDKDRDECDALNELMMDYLRANGEWCDHKSKHEGWYAHRKNRRAA